MYIHGKYYCLLLQGVTYAPNIHRTSIGAVPRKGKGRKWVAFGVVVKDGRDWMTAAKNVGMWHRGVERGAEALNNAWRRAYLRQSNVRRQRGASEFVQ